MSKTASASAVSVPGVVSFTVPTCRQRETLHGPDIKTLVAQERRKAHIEVVDVGRGQADAPDSGLRSAFTTALLIVVVGNFVAS